MTFVKNVNVNDEEMFIKKPWFKHYGKIIVGATCVLIGYKVGNVMCDIKTGMGLEAIFKNDPTLKEHMAEAISKTYKNKLLNNK